MPERKVYILWVDGLRYFDATDSIKKARSVFTDPVWVEKKAQRIKEKHPQWLVRVEERVV